jgi:hypothetical protein
MEQKLPNNKVNRWLVLAVVALFSLAATFAVYKIAMGSQSTEPVSDSQSTDEYVNKDVNAYVMLEQDFNYDEGYVDVYMTSTVPLTIAELVYAVESGTTFNSLSENTLFSDYITQDIVEGEVRVIATGGVEADVLDPVEEKTMFARVYFDNMVDGSVVLDMDETTFIDVDNKLVQVK